MHSAYEASIINKFEVYHDTSEGKKVCTYYNLVSMPAILVIDPVTGQKMRSWTGMVQPERILEDLLPFLEGGPQQKHFSLPLKRRREGIKESPVVLQEKQLEEDPDLLIAVAASLEESKAPVEACVDFESKIAVDTKSIVKKEPVYPPLPEEPKGNREEICRVGIRLPDGRRIQRNFLRSDPIELLWSFCSSQIEDARTLPFHFTQAIPGASKTLEYGSNTTFDESGLSNSMISMLWD
ncbi:hypothetical protein HPP92_014392 [Vanilla planifolia]|uniref:UBX domain-containing protein n=1 Tax=Vanilla planifolia TaxID=51239 RepID=A0A835QPD6_VANPL|nr:hypothetical protein HPP92_014392 [Vanilla planifolia]